MSEMSVSGEMVHQRYAIRHYVPTLNSLMWGKASSPHCGGSCTVLMYIVVTKFDLMLLNF